MLQLRVALRVLINGEDPRLLLLLRVALFRLLLLILRILSDDGVQ